MDLEFYNVHNIQPQRYYFKSYYRFINDTNVIIFKQ